MIVAIGGPPGSGKTTVGERFAAAHGYVLVSAGQKFRARAKERGLSLEAFGAAAASDPEIDRALDPLPRLKVLIDAPLAVRAQRIAGREKTSVKAAEKEIVERARLERGRYKSLYGIDLEDRSLYDLVIDSSDKTPDQIVDLVWARVGG